MVAETSETYIPDIDIDTDQPLQDILALPEPYLSITLSRWMDTYDDAFGGDVLIKTRDGTTVRLPFQTTNGSEFTVPPAGRRIPRRLALKLLEEFGPTGKYTNKDMSTGITPESWRTMQEAEKRLYNEAALKFNENYLIHIPDTKASQRAEFDFEDTERE